MNKIPKVVFSRTLERAEWADSRISRGDLAEEIATLKSEPGKDILAWGGAAFAQSLSRLGLVDEEPAPIRPTGYRTDAVAQRIGPRGSKGATACGGAWAPCWVTVFALPCSRRALA